MGEIFLPIEGFEGEYAISNYGRLYSYPRKGTKGGFYKSSKGDKYDCITLWGYKKHRSTTVHKLVYETFKGKIPSDIQINHKDEDKKNNAIWNLNLCTAKENANWGTRNKRAGEKHNKAIIQYTKDGDFIREWDSLTEASDFYGVKICTLYGALNGYKGAKTCKGYIWKYKERETD